jgi:DNA-binding NarL/FixJ family response regulator
MDENSQKSERLFAAFLAPRKILIADSHGGSRASLAKIIISLGGKTNNLLLVDNFEEALKLVQTVQPEILVVDYGLGNSHGLDLSSEIKNYRNKAENIFILVTSNSSQSTVAQAAEEDVDVFILKPYTIKGFSDILMKTVLVKIYPSDYIKTINSGKKMLEDQNPDGALLEFEKAAALSEKPTLAFYYRAQAELFKTMVTEAESSYNVGLKTNNLHYKCLTGFFDLLMDQKRKVDAYSVVKQISKFFPANPKRLGQVLSLAVNTGNFNDIEQYYDSFKEIETRSDELVKYICAALVVCGKHFFRQKENDKALEFLKKATISAAGRTLILKEVISVLVEFGFFKEAQDVLNRFPETSKNEMNFKIADFLIKNGSESEKAKLIPALREMVREKITEPMIWYWLIVDLIALDKIDEAETVCEDAIKLWPEKVDYFEKPFD